MGQVGIPATALIAIADLAVDEDVLVGLIVEPGRTGRRPLAQGVLI